jgi:hypothetical protein
MTADPEFAAALACHQAGDLAQAERLYREILASDEQRAALNNLALLLDATGRGAEAREVYERAVRRFPDDPRTHYALANHHRERRELEAAEDPYRRTIALQPDHPTARLDLGLTLLGMGRYTEGWTLYETRRARTRMLAANLPFPEWRGEPLAGKRLLVLREQGFGDQIMMARFVDGLGASEVTYVGPPELHRMFSQLPLTYVDVTPGEARGHLDHDYWALPFSLPAILGVTLETIPAEPYLRGTPRTSGARVGLVWRGGPGNRNQRFRMLPEPLAERLLAMDGVISLEPEASGARDFQDTADIVAGLELVVSVDTSMAHLAGAMGRPAWVLLPAHGLDWQWLRERPDSPWYPSVRLIRQPAPGDWDAVFEQVSAGLAQTAAR